MPYHIKPEIIIDGTLYTLVIFSILTWTLVFFKIWQFGKNSYYNRRFNQAFWEAANLSEAKSLPAPIARGPEARIASQGFVWLEESQSPAKKNSLKFFGQPSDLLEHALLVQMQNAQ